MATPIAPANINSIMSNVARCPYCYTPIFEIGEEEGQISEEIANFYDDIGLKYNWTTDPIKTKHGAKYRWYQGDYPNEFFYKNKLYVVYDKAITREDEEGNSYLDYSNRKYTGFDYMTNKSILTELQEYRSWLEEYIGLYDIIDAESYAGSSSFYENRLSELTKSDFTDLNTFDEGSGHIRWKKSHIQELRDSTENIALLYSGGGAWGNGLDYFNYTETGKKIILKNINDGEYSRLTWKTPNLSLWDGHIRNVHVEDLRHPLLGFFVEDWTGHGFTNSWSLSNSDPDNPISDSETNISEGTFRYWACTQNGYAVGGNPGTTTINTEANLNLSGISITVSVSTTGSINFQGRGSGGARYLITLDPYLIVNKNTKIIIENFQQSEPYATIPGVGILPPNLAYNFATIRFSFKPTLGEGFSGDMKISCGAYALGSDYTQPDYVTQEGNNLIINFENNPEAWGRHIFQIELTNIGCGVNPNYPGDHVASRSITVSCGRIMIYPISFAPNMYPQIGHSAPTGYSARIADPLPEDD